MKTTIMILLILLVSCSSVFEPELRYKYGEGDPFMSYVHTSKTYYTDIEVWKIRSKGTVTQRIDGKFEDVVLNVNIYNIDEQLLFTLTSPLYDPFTGDLSTSIEAVFDDIGVTAQTSITQPMYYDAMIIARSWLSYKQIKE